VTQFMNLILTGLLPPVRRSVLIYIQKVTSCNLIEVFVLSYLMKLHQNIELFN